MQLQGASASAPTAAGQSSTAVTNAVSGLGRDAFLNLLVAQMRHQDPTQPMDDREFISQLAQFSSLEQMTNVSDGLGVLASMQNTTQAILLVGKTVTLTNPAGGDPIVGLVEEVRFAGGQPRLVVGGREFELSSIVSVR